jgi:tRNA (guanosine-2'-O-)-methyltransferase
MDLPEGTSHGYKQLLLSYLMSFISDNKLRKFREIISQRTRFITIVLEDIFQPHNASAVLRSCDCFGIQDIHIIENANLYEVNPDVALGASKWLTIKKYNRSHFNTPDCLSALKSSGYLIVATTPHKNDFTPENYPLDQKFALVFGTELEGLTPSVMEMADRFIRIPMVGFTESLNISVSAAILLRQLSERLRTSGMDWQLDESEQVDVLLDWAAGVIKKSELLVAGFLRNNPPEMIP